MWFDEIASIVRQIESFEPRGRVLELASGTGWWTKELARFSSDVTAVDVSPKAIGVASRRAPSARFIQADLFEWEPDVRGETRFWKRELRPDGVVIRTLNDGSEYRIVKHYYTPDDLEERLSRMGWDVRVSNTEWFFYYGHGSHD